MSSLQKRLNKLETIASLRKREGVIVVEQIAGNSFLFEGKKYTEDLLAQEIDRRGVDVVIIDDLHINSIIQAL